MRRQVADAEPVPQVSPDSTSVHGKPDPISAMRVAGEFYQRYEAMPVLASTQGVARFTDLLADDFRLEDPTAGRSEERRVGKECRSRWSAHHPTRERPAWRHSRALSA